MNLIKAIGRSYSKSLIVAGYKSADYKAASILKMLKQLEPGMEFYGIGGEKMFEHEGFKSYGKLRKKADKPFEQRKTQYFDFRVYTHMANIKTNWNNFKLMRSAKGLFDFLEKEETIKDTSLMVTVGNQLLSARILERVNRYCNRYNLLKPLAIHVDVTRRLFKYRNHEYLDYHIFTMPAVCMNTDYYDFPGKFIGKQVLFDAWKFLYNQDSKYKDMVQGNVIYLQKELNNLIMEELIFKVRQKFRKERKIEESSNVFFISPGDQLHEIKKNLSLTRKAFKMFFRRFLAGGRLSKKNFDVIISLPEKNIKLAKKLRKFEKLGVKVHVIYGNENNQRYEAMAASDLAASHIGDSVMECAAFQLPTIILDNKGFYEAYMSLLYNVYNHEINLVEDGEIYPETVGMNFPAKLAEIWGKWFVNPKDRYRLAIETNKRLLKFLPEISSKNKYSELEIDSNLFQGYSEPDYELKNFLKESLDKVNELKKKKLTHPKQIKNERDSVLGLSL